MYKQDLALNNLKWLIYDTTNQFTINNFCTIIVSSNYSYSIINRVPIKYK